MAKKTRIQSHGQRKTDLVRKNNAGRPAVPCRYEKAWIESPRIKMHGKYAIFTRDVAHNVGDICIARVYKRSLTANQLARIIAGFIDTVNRELGTGGEG